MKKIVFISATLLLGCIIQVLGQNRHIMGTIKCSNDSTPLNLASVVLKGTTIGTASDEKGDFSLNIPEYYSHYNTLCFSFIGMKSREIEIADRGQDDINLYMEVDFLPLAEVTIVYDTLTGQSRTYLATFKKDGALDMLVHIVDSVQTDDRLRILR